MIDRVVLLRFSDALIRASEAADEMKALYKEHPEMAYTFDSCIETARKLGASELQLQPGDFEAAKAQAMETQGS